MSPVKRRGLGRGLDALLTPQIKAPALEEKESGDTAPKDGDLRKISIDKLLPGKYQPRKDMSDAALEELSLSIQSQGIIQPIVVRLLDEDEGEFEIIAGERRWRAAKLAGLKKIPVHIVKVKNDAELMEMALIENIQRENLNSIEEAEAFDVLQNKFIDKK